MAGFTGGEFNTVLNSPPVKPAISLGGKNLITNSRNCTCQQNPTTRREPCWEYVHLIAYESDNKCLWNSAAAFHVVLNTV